MMSRPQPKTDQVAPVEQKEESKPKTSSEHVEDLERRLAMLGSVTTPVEEPAAAPEETKQDDPPPSFAVAPVAETKPATTEIKGGKTALLVSSFRGNFRYPLHD